MLIPERVIRGPGINQVDIQSKEYLPIIRYITIGESI